MRQTRKKRRSYKRVIILAVILFLVFAGVAYSYLGGSLQSKRNAEPGMMVSANAVNIMIMGIDSRQDDVGRSDTLMVASVDKDKGTATLLSVPRDTRVSIAGHGYDKINHAYAFGGHELSKDTVEHLLGVTMDYYILIDVHAFERIIDAIGGVDINVEKRMFYEDKWDDDGGLLIDLYPGEQHMDGKKAIQYVRYRDGEGDIGRIARQQKFVKAVLDKVISPQILPRLPQIIEEVQKAIKTDMSLAEMLDFAKQLKQVRDNGLEAKMVPGKPAYLHDVSYWLPDIVGLRTLLAENMGLPFTGEIEARADEAAAEYAASLPAGLQVVEEGSTVSTLITADESAVKEEKASKPSEISVLVINSSGINGAGARAADVLRRKGFIISGVETGKTSARESTTLMTSQKNTGLFYGMPFPCTIMSGGDPGQAVLNIGRDYK